jgi:Domain of unknown function (DUF4411)
MKYVFDSGPFIDCRYYYPNIFKSYWDKLNQLVGNGDIISVKEVYNEILKGSDIISDWANQNSGIFEEPSGGEFEIVKDIMSKHKELIRLVNFTGGTPVADPFIIAKAEVNNLVVVTQEIFRENAHKIPNICKEHNVNYMTLEEFMLNEGWEF